MTAENSTKQLPVATILIVFGYGLFRSVNSSVYQSAFDLADSGFMFIANIAFTCVVTVMIIATAAILGIAAYKGRIRTLHMPYITPLILFSLAILISSFDVFEAVVAPYEIIVLALLFAFQSVAISLAWIELFTLQKLSDAIIQIGCAMVFGAICSYFITLVPASLLPIIEVVALIGSGYCLYKSRNIIKEHSKEELFLFDSIPLAKTQEKNRRSLLALSDSLVAFFALEAVIGLLNSFMLAGNMHYENAGLTTGIAMTIAAILFCILALAAQNAPRINTVFRFSVPILAGMVVFIPFFNEGYSLLFNTLLLASYDFIAIAVTFQIAATSHKYHINGYAVLAAAIAGARVCLLIALLAGYTLGYLSETSQPSYIHFLFLACGIIYLFAMVSIFLSRDHHKKKNARVQLSVHASQEPIEQVKSSSITEEPLTDEPDHIQLRCDELAQQYSLTAKETEVLNYLARGRSNTYIAEEFVISPTTVRSHIRHIYSKLDIHKRQELIDLFDERPLKL